MKRIGIDFAERFAIAGSVTGYRDGASWQLRCEQCGWSCRMQGLNAEIVEAGTRHKNECRHDDIGDDE